MTDESLKLIGVFVRKAAELVALAITEIVTLRDANKTQAEKIDDLTRQLENAGQQDTDVTGDELTQLDGLFPLGDAGGDGVDTVAGDDGGNPAPAPVIETPTGEGNFLISSPEGQPDGSVVRRAVGVSSGTSPAVAVKRFRSENPHLASVTLNAHKQA